MTTTTAPSGSLVRATCLVLLSKSGPLDALELHAKVEELLGEHNYGTVPLADVSTALSSLRAKGNIRESGDGPGATRFVSSEEGDNLLVDVLLRIRASDNYALALTLAYEARV